MFKATLTAIVFILSCVSGKPVTSQNDDFIFENFDFDGISTVRDQGPGLVGIITPLLRKPVYIPDDYDESVCPELPEAGCESVRLMTFYGIECAYCVIKEGERCSDTNQLSLTNTKANCDEGLACLPDTASDNFKHFTCQKPGEGNAYKVESSRNIFDKNTVPMKYADSETPCKDHYDHWMKIVNKKMKHWKPVCDANGFYDVTRAQCTEDMMCWCTDKRGNVVAENTADCGKLIFAKY